MRRNPYFFIPHPSSLLKVREVLGLLFEERLKGSFGESLSGIGGNLLHAAEINIESRPIVAERPFRNNFAPLGRQVTDILEFLGGSVRAWSSAVLPCTCGERR